jgi:osmotically-inducible protein OsmY
MKLIRTFVGGVIVGSVVGFLFDPARGRSRRTQVVQRGGRLLRRVRRRTERQVSMATSRATGLFERSRHLTVEDREPTDEKLRDRVQSQLFREPDIPKGDVNVHVENGAVILRGHVDSDAMKSRLSIKARSIQGVDRVENLINVTD